MKEFTPYGITTMVAISAVVYWSVTKDSFLTLVVAPLVLFVLLTFWAIREIKTRRQQKMDKELQQAMLAEAQQELAARISTGKAKDKTDALNQMQQEGFWKRLSSKFKKTPPPQENKIVLQKEEPTKQTWAFEEELPPLPVDNLSVEDAKQKGTDYSDLIENILDKGTTDWNDRIGQLDQLKQSIETTVKKLKLSYDEMRHERALVENLARLKQKRLELRKA